MKPKTTKNTKMLPLFVSPSLWQTWSKCALSLQSVKSPFSTASDDYAESGTNIHAAIAEDLRSGCAWKENDPDDAAVIRFAVETTKSIKESTEADAGKVAIFIEHSVKKTVKGVTIGGTADYALVPYAIERDDKCITIVDHKTGWKEVEAEGNLQLKIYAHLFAQEFKGTTKWKGVIINARFNSTSYTGGEIDPKFLPSLATDLKKRTAEGQFQVGNHCAYCPRLTTCAKLRKEVEKWLVPGAIDSLSRDPENLAAALRLAKPAEKLFDTIKKEAQLFIDLGGVIPGVSVEYSPGNRTWPQDLSVATLADKVGLKIKDFIVEKPVTPAEAERRGADKEAIDAITLRPPRKGFKFS